MFEQLMITGLSGAIIIVCIYAFKIFRNKLAKHWHYLVALIVNFIILALLVNLIDDTSTTLLPALLLELSFVLLLFMWISFAFKKKKESEKKEKQH